MRYSSKWPKYAQWWDAMKINDDRVKRFERDAQFAIEHKGIYKQIEAATGVPWVMVACNHRRESDANFNTYLGNGQPLNRVTTIVPKGRGPFTGPNAFVDGGIDAYKLDRLAEVRDWRLEKMLFWMESFNGSGYDTKGLPSPYIWGGTNIQRPGKYVADHQFNSGVMDTQPGCAPLLATIARLDPSVKFIRETEGAEVPVKPPVPPGEIDKPVTKTFWQWIVGGAVAMVAAVAASGVDWWIVGSIVIGAGLIGAIVFSALRNRN